MPISSDNRQAGPYVGNDVAATFAFSFKVFAETDLLVILTDASGAENELTLSADYSVTLNSNQDSNPGGSVTLPSALSSANKLTITSSILPLQATDLSNQGGFYPKVITNALDKLTILVQQLFNGLSRSIKLPISNGEDGTLPAGDRSSTAVGFDASGKLSLIGLQTGTALADLAASTGAALIGFMQVGAGASKRSMQDKMRDIVSVKDFGAKGDGVTDDYQAIQSALNASDKIDLGEGNFKLSAQLVASTRHRIIGRGFSKTTLSPTHSGFTILVPAPALDTKVSLCLDAFLIAGKNGVQVGGSKSSFSTDGAIIGGHINIAVTGTYGASSGDPCYNTNKIRDTNNSAVSSATGTSLSALNSYADVSAFGVGVQLSKCIDTEIVAPQFYGNGISVVLLGCDIVKWRGGRSHEVGWFLYEERIGSWGSQSKVIDVDLLHNRRAGGLVCNSTKWSQFNGNYYECYSDSALVLWADGTEGVLFEKNRIDDPYYTGGGGSASGSTPLIVVSNPYMNNRVRFNRFQKFSPWGTQAPTIRAVGYAQQDSNHVELLAVDDNGPFFGFMDQAIPGYRRGPLSKSRYGYDNIPYNIYGNFAPLFVKDSGTFAIYNASSSIYPAVRIDIERLRSAYSLYVRAKTSSGTTLFLTITQNSLSGASKGTVFSGTLGGFTSSAYSTQTQSLTLPAEPEPGDYILVSWTANAVYIKSIDLQ